MILRMVFTAAAAAATITLGGTAQARNGMGVLGRTQEASRFADAPTRTGQTVLLRGSGRQVDVELRHRPLFRAHYRRDRHPHLRYPATNDFPGDARV